jgi:hypothetical protein
MKGDLTVDEVGEKSNRFGRNERPTTVGDWRFQAASLSQRGRSVVSSNAMLRSTTGLSLLMEPNELVNVQSALQSRACNLLNLVIY